MLIPDHTYPFFTSKERDDILSQLKGKVIEIEYEDIYSDCGVIYVKTYRKE